MTQIQSPPDLPRLQWPAVFTEPLDAPYMPDLAPIQRRGIASVDGLMAWAICMSGRDLAGELPANFGQVVVKLRQAAGIASASPEAFSAAQEAWLAEREAQGGSG